jgi:hypothetical protein
MCCRNEKKNAASSLDIDEDHIEFANQESAILEATYSPITYQRTRSLNVLNADRQTGGDVQLFTRECMWIHVQPGRSVSPGDREGGEGGWETICILRSILLAVQERR